MAITGITAKKWKAFVQNGGELIAEIDAEDISSDRSFEESKEISHNLTTGFEIRPSTIVYDEDIGDMIELLGEPWVKLCVSVYRKGGNIIYRKLSNGRYEAKMKIAL